MKKILLMSSLILPTMATGLFAADASYTTSSTISRESSEDNGAAIVVVDHTHTIQDSVATSVTATSLNSSGSSNTVVGNSTGTTTVTGSSVTVNGAADLNNGLNVDGDSTLDATAITGTTTINTSGNASATLGANGNSTSILSSTVSIGTGAYTTQVSVGSTQSGTSVNLISGNSSTNMGNNSIVSTVDGDENAGNGVISISNTGTQYISNENGEISTREGDGSSVTAALVVENSDGNTHGIVVEEDKTTISGGVNSSSLTLDDFGATFSDPANGRPIQVHGVADGTADFDATNVRQVYSGLAAVLAATPELTLEPGKSAMGIGIGSYGGFNAVGIGIGHMYDNGAVLTASVSKAPESQAAYKASLSWNW